MLTAHPSAKTGSSQCSLILAELTRRAGEWVPMPALYAVSGAFAVHSRIADLRRAGHIIRQRNLHRGKMILSEYLLEAPADSTPTQPQHQPQP